MPPDVPEWLSERPLRRFVIDAVEEIDLEAFYAGTASKGASGRSMAGDDGARCCHGEMMRLGFRRRRWGGEWTAAPRMRRLSRERS
jgi:hypothetical protein